MKQSTNTWYAMEQKIDAEGNESSKAEIFIYDEIGGYEVNANTFIGQLEALEGIEQIDLRISSPGGSIVEGNVIFNAIKRHPANVTVYIDGMAASMASVIAMAGDEVLMADNALLMIHNPWTVSIGDSEQLRKDADLMDKMKSAIINAYSRSNYSTEELEELMDSTTWFTADEAFEAGFIDGTVEGLQAAATLSEMETIAKQAGATLPVEKIVSSIVAKNDAKVALLENQIQGLETAVDEYSTEIEELQNSAKDFITQKEIMETNHKSELEASQEITAQAVSCAAAELMALQTQEAIAESSNETETKVDAESFWANYKAVGKAEGLEAKNKWFKENKHLIQK